MTKLSDADKKIFSDVALEAAQRATDKIKKREAELVEEFKKKGLGVHQVNRQSFVDAVTKAKPVPSLGYDQKDYDRIIAIK
jgi:TRAP-type C4-dicarboxylate transport system substrate-binding protein